ncbi:MAG: hypothetical protein KDD66_05240 [Bdellovibrionales bacterium]|nr:hypothetical protein [Bdellovibrionales bacterium]
MNRSYSYSSIKFLLMLGILSGVIFSMYSSVWAASDVAVSVSSDFLKRLNQKLTQQVVRAPQQPAAAEEVQPESQEKTAPADTAPRIKQPAADASFGPAPAFIHNNGRFIESTPDGVMLGWWDLPTGTIVFGYGPGGGIRDAFVVTHGTEKSFLKPENLSTALASSKIAGLKLPDGIAYQELMYSQYISETPANVEHGWWDLPDGTIVFARNSSGRPTGAYEVIDGEKIHLKPVSMDYAIQHAGARAAAGPSRKGAGAQQPAQAQNSRSSWIGQEYKF